MCKYFKVTFFNFSSNFSFMMEKQCREHRKMKPIKYCKCPISDHNGCLLNEI